MGQVFHPSANTIAKVSIFGSLFILSGIVWLLAMFTRSPYVTQVGVAIEQPIPFSHKHHVEGLGIDCRFCHTSVETSAFAGIPSTAVCMKCHNVLWSDSPTLELVRESHKTGKPIEWNRVHDLPDHVYFDHSIHVAKGVGCTSCHGQVDKMPLTWRENTLHMEWCLSCHKNPENHIRPKEEVFNTNWHPPVGEDPKELSQKLAKEYNIGSNLTNCTVCHR